MCHLPLGDSDIRSWKEPLTFCFHQLHNSNKFSSCEIFYLYREERTSWWSAKKRMLLSSWHRVIAWQKTSTVGQSPYWFTMASWLHRVLPTILLNWLVIFAVATKGWLYFWSVWRVLICWRAGYSFDSNCNRRKVIPWGWTILIN